MAANRARSIRYQIPLHNVGRLKWFKPSQSLLSIYQSNRKFRRIMATANRQLAPLSFYELFQFVALSDREMIYEDFRDIELEFGESKALDLLRDYFIENYLFNELIRISYDPTKPLPGLIQLLKTHLLNALAIENSRVRQALLLLRNSFKFNVITPAILLPQRSPNAPNTAPALSLVAA
jgi:hypothetical protein